MTDTLPAVRPRSELDDLARLGQWLAWAESGNQDEKSRGAGAALRLYYARELGLTPMAASELSLINGRLVVGAALLRALARRAGYWIQRLEDNDTSCTARITDTNGQVLGHATFTIEDARRAGLIRDRSAWKTHPARMLWARASANVIKDFAPEVALGMVLDDEVQEITQPSPRNHAAHEWPWDDVDEAELEKDELDLTDYSYRPPPDYRPAPEQEPLPDPTDDDPDPAGKDVDDIEF